MHGRYLFPILAALIGLASSPTPACGGTVVGWGDTNNNLSASCACDVVAIAAGNTHNLLLKNDGTVIARGAPSVAFVPFGLSNVIAVAAGYLHSLALKADGTVVAWGWDWYGVTNVPPDLTNVIAIAAGSRQSLALKADGSVVSWGTDSTNLPSGLTNVVAVTAGWGNGMVLKASGTVEGWGAGQSFDSAALAGLSNIVAISGADNCCYDLWLAMRADGQVIRIRGPSYGGIVTILDNVVAISASRGTDHHINLALKSDGTVTPILGYNFYKAGYCPPPRPPPQFDTCPFPDVPWGLSNVIAVASGGNHNLALIAGGAPFVTENPVGRTVGISGTTRFRVAATGSLPLNYQWSHAGTNLPGATSALLTLQNVQPHDSGNYSVTVSNAFGVAVSTDAILTISPLLITKHLVDQQTYVNSTAIFSVEAQGQTPLAYQWQKDGVLLGATSNPLILANVSRSQGGVYQVTVSNPLSTNQSAGNLFVAPVAMWPDPSTLWVDGAKLPLYLTNALAVAAGFAHVMVLKGDGTVWAGGNSSDNRLVPPGLSNVIAIAAGDSHSLALKGDGTLALWGSQSFGLSSVSAEMTNIVAIEAGSSHSVALRADGTVIAWGNNASGQTNVPVSLSNVVSIAAGGNFCYAMRDDGTVVGWGNQPSAPSLPLLEAIACGAGHCLGIKSDRTVFAWGVNTSGQTNVPTALSNVISVAAGSLHSLAIRADGGVVAWGYNSNGQTNVPSNLTNVMAVAGHLSLSMALIGDAQPAVQSLVLGPVQDANGFRIRVPTQSGRVYRLEFKSSLTDANWTSLSLVAGNGGLRILSDPLATGAQRFYRVRRW